MASIGVWAFWRVSEGVESEAASVIALSGSAGFGLALGAALWVLARGVPLVVGRREALLLVAASWLLGALLSGLPYYIWPVWDIESGATHPFHSAVDCYFEAMSGLTTTGATILSDVSALPKSLLLWRSLTQWLGGVGIVVLFVAVLPSLGVGGKNLYRVEAPGPKSEGIHPQIRETARTLWLIYLGLTLLAAFLFRVFGMDWIDSVSHALCALATGGFSTKNSSIGGFNSASIDMITILFMFLAGVNFSVYHQAVTGKVRSIFKDTELLCYITFLVVGSVIVSACLFNQPIITTSGEVLEPSAAQAVRHGVFATASQQTTTGFCTADFNGWPFVAKGVLIVLMFVGGCSGSTAGGIKVMRVWIAIKVMASELEKIFRPHVVRPVKVSDAVVDEELKLGTLAYVLGILVIWAAGAGLIMLFEQASHECSLTTAGTASLATVCNIGPGLGKVGAVENYGWFTAQSKLVMCVLMVIGRLEVFAIAVLFLPRFWRGD